MNRTKHAWALIVAIGLAAWVSEAVGQADVHPIFESAAAPAAAGEIDRLVFGKLASLGIQPVLCSDAVFVRRAYLDIIGTLPTADEVRQFLDDTDLNKRAALVDRLLDRPEFPDYWSMRWGDILRIKAEFPINLWPNAAQAYHRWVWESLARNKPYDQFARELLTSSGSNFRVGPVNFYRAMQNRTPEGTAGAVALTLMGTRTDNWPPERVSGMAAFFSQIGYKPTREWKEELVFWDPLKSAVPFANVAADNPTEKKPEDAPAEPPPPTEPGPIEAVLPDGTNVVIPPGKDPREVFADWLIRPENPWFTRAIANRVWYWLMGRGIVHEPDDLRDDNPPSHPELLAYLQKELVGSGYDLKHLYRLILKSTTYQLSSLRRTDKPEAAALMAAYPVRRLEAEVLIDALNQITGTSELYTSPIPEPFTYIPSDLRAIAIGDGSITSSFLTLFGRSARATGMENERSNKPLASQWLHMLNSSQVQQKLERGPKMRELLESPRPAAEIVEELYLRILSRRPTEEELKVVEQLTANPRARREAAIDLAWALINSTEFLYRH